MEKYQYYTDLSAGPEISTPGSIGTENVVTKTL